LEPFKGGAKGLEIIRKADIPRRVEGAVRTSQEEMVVSRWGVLKHGKQDVEHCKPGEGTVDVALTCATFWVESKLLDAGKALEIPAFKGKGSADDSVPRLVKVHEPLRDREGDTKALPTQEDEGFGDGVKRFLHVPGAPIEGTLLVPCGFKSVE